MSDPNERESLEQLVTSPGWLIFHAFVKQQWGPAGYGVLLKQAINQAKAANHDLSEAVARVDAANEAVNAVLSWPTHRIQDLLAHEARRKQEAQIPLSRRGSL